MNQYNITICVDRKIVSTILAILMIGFLGLNHISTKASTAALTGKCGMLLNTNFFGFEAAQYNQSGQVPNTLGYIDFDNGSVEMAQANITNFGLSSATAAAAKSVKTGKFSQSVGPVTGSYSLIFSSNGTTLNIFPVNAGNSLLVQFPGNGTQAAPATGICQKI